MAADIDVDRDDTVTADEAVLYLKRLQMTLRQLHRELYLLGAMPATLGDVGRFDRRRKAVLLFTDVTETVNNVIRALESSSQQGDTP